MMWKHLRSSIPWGLVLGLLPPSPAVVRAQTVPAGTRLLVRFLEPITSGRAEVGSVVRLQSLAALASSGCDVIPAFVSLAAHVETSSAGRTALQRGRLGLAFDSIEAAPGRWYPIGAVLDSLEWSPRRVRHGTVLSGRHSLFATIAEPAGLLLLGVATAPAAGLELAHLIHRPRVSVLPGEEAAIILAAPFNAPPGTPCATSPDLRSDLTLPPLEARATTSQGADTGDPINLVILGNDSDLVRAFDHADWVSASSSNFGHTVVAVVDAALSHHDRRAPVSPAYYDGRVEDLAVERASPSARVRHHLRLWNMEFPSTGERLWAGAATEDVGLLLKPGRTPTHRIDSKVDQERDLVVRELLAGGCASLEGYTQLPAASLKGRNTAGQRYTTDGRTAVVRILPCLPVDHP